jgi:peptidoglycan-associated lipoprotein
MVRPSEFAPDPNLKTIYFDFDKYDVRPGDAKILDGNGAWLKTNADNLLLIEGNCDERGTAEYNLALGEKRAKAAMNYLVAQGIQANRVTIISYGKERPVCSEKTEACWAHEPARQLPDEGPVSQAEGPSVMQSVMTKGDLWLPLGRFQSPSPWAGAASTMDETTQQEMAQLRRDVNAPQSGVPKRRPAGSADTSLNQIDRRSREQAAENARQTAAMNTPPRVPLGGGESAPQPGRTSSAVGWTARAGRRAGAVDRAHRPTTRRPRPLPSGWVEIIGTSREPRKATKAAYSDFTKGNYTLAVAEFREFVRQYPDSPAWTVRSTGSGSPTSALGRAAAAAGQPEKSREALERSVQEFRKVFVNYPGGRQCRPPSTRKRWPSSSSSR